MFVGGDDTFKNNHSLLFVGSYKLSEFFSRLNFSGAHLRLKQLAFLSGSLLNNRLHPPTVR